MMTDFFEVGPYRPPSEAYSLLLRVTRNCPWNRCKFCCMYKGNKFEYRSVADIKQDIIAAKNIEGKIKELSSKASYENSGITEVAARVFNNPPNEAYRNVALWLYANGETAFLQDSNSLIMRINELVEVIRFFLRKSCPASSG